MKHTLGLWDAHWKWMRPGVDERIQFLITSHTIFARSIFSITVKVVIVVYWTDPHLWRHSSEKQTLRVCTSEVRSWHLFIYSFTVLIDKDSLVSTFFGNSLLLISALYYIYISFLGYSNSVPANLKEKTKRIFLLSVGFVMLVYVVTLCANYSMCRSIMNFYHYRVAGERISYDKH